VDGARRHGLDGRRRLQELHVEVRRHNVIGELVTCDGEVTDVDAATGRVDIRLAAVNQDGEESARGSAVVVLPTGGGEAGRS
jgi:hypothetical protein